MTIQKTRWVTVVECVRCHARHDIPKDRGAAYAICPECDGRRCVIIGPKLIPPTPPKNCCAYSGTPECACG